MPSIFDYIQDAFKKPKLNDEDWLNPSDRVLSNIESEINKDDNGKKPFIFFFVTAAVFLISVPVLLHFNFQNEQTRHDNKVSLPDEVVSKEKIKREMDIVTTTALSKVKKQVVENNQQKSLESKASQKASAKNSNEISSPIKKEASFTKNHDQTLSTDKLEKPYQVAVTKVQNPASSNFELIEVERSNLKDSNNSLDDVSARMDSKVVDKQFAIVQNLPNSELELMTETNTSLPLLNVEGVKIDRNKSLFVQTSSGVSIWNFALNDAYKEAVEPAAFTNSYGLGYSFALQAGKELNKRVSFVASIQMESIHFSSGHNSEISIDNTLPEQKETLTMATPLGLIDNEVALFRTGETSTGNTDLLIDLHNEHQLTALELGLKANIKFIDQEKFSISASPGFGVMQVLGSNNMLSSIDTNNESIADGGTLVAGDFENVIKTSPVVSLGLGLNQQFSDNWEVGILLNGSVNLRPIQRKADFQTNVTRGGATLLLRRNF